MKISELIATLTQIQKAEGDLEVALDDDLADGAAYSPNSVLARDVRPDSFFKDAPELGNRFVMISNE
jgi:hypothetical protein